jgi:hypothetical protein
MDLPRRRGELIKSLKEVLAISEELNDSDTGYLIGALLTKPDRSSSHQSRDMLESQHPGCVLPR